MPHVVILPHVIEKKLKVEERQEVLTFINDIIAYGFHISNFFPG